ncbi:MAG: family 16 glycosylhydrolase [Mariniblastus sp.]
MKPNVARISNCFPFIIQSTSQMHQTKIRFSLFLSLLICSAGCVQSTTEPAVKADSDKEIETQTSIEVPEGWNLVWSDEFEGTELDTKKWKHETGAWGWGNNEWQDYKDATGDNVTVGEGVLKITAKKTGAGQKVGDYTSARLNSLEKFTYGRMEIRAKMPAYKGKGIWPAIWMLGANIKDAGWPQCGELDILEYVSYRKGKMHSAIHCKSHNHGDKTQVETGPMDLDTIESEFHVYGLEWTEDKVVFYTDKPENVKLAYERPKKFDADNWPFDKPHFFLLNVAVGGDWGGEEGVEDKIFPSTMEVDFVRVFQKK